jgi:hypothetical protein
MYDDNIVNYITTYFLLLALVPHYMFHTYNFIGQIYYGIVIAQRLLRVGAKWHHGKYHKKYWNSRMIDGTKQYFFRYMSLRLNYAIDAGAAHIAS